MALNFKKGGDVKNRSAQIAAGGVADADAVAVGGAGILMRDRLKTSRVQAKQGAHRLAFRDALSGSIVAGHLFVAEE